MFIQNLLKKQHITILTLLAVLNSFNAEAEVLKKKKNLKKKNQITNAQILNQNNLNNNNNNETQSIQTVSATQKTSVSVANLNNMQTKSKKPLPITLSDSFDIYGPTLIEPQTLKLHDSGINKDTGLGEQIGLSTRHRVSLMYKASDTVSFGPVADFSMQMTRANPTQEQMGVQWKDSYFRINKSNLLQAKIGKIKMNLNSNLRLFAPTSQGSKNNKVIGSAALFLVPTFASDNSKLSFSLVTFARSWINSQGSNEKNTALNAYQIYARPTLNYDISDKTSAFLLVEAYDTFDTQGQPLSKRDKNESLVDIEPGMNFTLNKHLSLSPYLNWFTAQPIKTTSINLNVNLSM